MNRIKELPILIEYCRQQALLKRRPDGSTRIWWMHRVFMYEQELEKLVNSFVPE